MRRTRRGAALIGIALIVGACTGNGVATQAPGGATPAPVGTTAAGPCADSTDPTVVDTSVGENTWASVSATVNDVITWTNTDAVPHRVALDDASCEMSGNIPGGGTRSLVFTQAGSFPFHCGVHPSMKGTITIT